MLMNEGFQGAELIAEIARTHSGLAVIELTDRRLDIEPIDLEEKGDPSRPRISVNIRDGETVFGTEVTAEVEVGTGIGWRISLHRHPPEEISIGVYLQ
jgi:hypothetical protein